MDESLVQYGTPLESLNESNFHLSKAPKLSDQIVTDKQGRRRFHGAFTGGFSAGYFNSVGTKEGWAPSTFVSSRAQRAEKKVANDPTAYMDEEDLDGFGIATQRILASSDYEDPSKFVGKRKRGEDFSGPIPGQPVLKELLKPINVTVGMKFLMKLGWRPGQGVGPRLSMRDKRKLQKEKDISMRQRSESSDSDNEEQSKNSFHFAPDDIDNSSPLIIKSNFFGLGYKPLERTNVLGGNSGFDNSQLFRMTDKKRKLAIRGQAFGVGAFEDEDADIYTHEDMSEYDFDLGASKKDNTQKKRERSRWDSQISLMGEVLEGFQISSKPFQKPKGIPLPQLPPNFNPFHQSYKRRFEDSKVDVGNQERLTADERRNIVSNTPVVEIRSGIKKAEEKVDNLFGYKKEFSKTFVDESQNEAIPSSSISDYRPFAAYPEKQKRYDAYIRTKGMEKDGIFPSHMTDWEKEKEKGEFQRAETFNRPLSFNMSSRFTSALYEDKLTHLQEGLNDMKGNVNVQKDERVPFYAPEMKDDMKAAKQKLFGHLTQAQVDWHPDKLLCKRFNVPNPYPTSTAVGVISAQKEKLSLFSILPTNSQANSQDYEKESLNQRTEGGGSNENSTLSEETKETEEDFGLKVPVSGPPTMDLFNAIFQDSSDSEDENEQPKNEVTKDIPKETSNDGIIKKEDLKLDNQNKNFPLISLLDNSSSEDEFGPKLKRETANESNKSFKNSLNNGRKGKLVPDTDNNEFGDRKMEAKGIFKGIDFGALNQYRSLCQSQEDENGSSKERNSVLPSNELGRSRSHSDSSSDSDEDGPMQLDEDEYGPPLPPHMSEIKSSVISTNMILGLNPSRSSSLEELERKHKKSKKQKKKNKHKHKRKKSKHRK